MNLGEALVRLLVRNIFTISSAALAGIACYGGLVSINKSRKRLQALLTLKEMTVSDLMHQMNSENRSMYAAVRGTLNPQFSGLQAKGHDAVRVKTTAIEHYAIVTGSNWDKRQREVASRVAVCPVVLRDENNRTAIKIDTMNHLLDPLPFTNVASQYMTSSVPGREHYQSIALEVKTDIIPAGLPIVAIGEFVLQAGKPVLTESQYKACGLFKGTLKDAIKYYQDGLTMQHVMTYLFMAISIGCIAYLIKSEIDQYRFYRQRHRDYVELLARLDRAQEELEEQNRLDEERAEREHAAHEAQRITRRANRAIRRQTRRERQEQEGQEDETDDDEHSPAVEAAEAVVHEHCHEGAADNEAGRAREGRGQEGQEGQECVEGNEEAALVAMGQQQPESADGSGTAAEKAKLQPANSNSSDDDDDDDDDDDGEGWFGGVAASKSNDDVDVGEGRNQQIEDKEEGENGEALADITEKEEVVPEHLQALRFLQDVLNVIKDAKLDEEDDEEEAYMRNIVNNNNNDVNNNNDANANHANNVVMPEGFRLNANGVLEIDSDADDDDDDDDFEDYDHHHGLSDSDDSDASVHHPGHHHGPKAAMCTVCLCNQSDVVVLPCRHVALCHGCAAHFFQRGDYFRKPCPVCRSIINEFFMIYFS